MKNSSRPATVDDDKLHKNFEKSLSFVIDPDFDKKSTEESEDVEVKNDSEELVTISTENQDDEKKIVKKLQSGSEFDLDFLDDDKWNTDIEEEGKQKNFRFFFYYFYYFFLHIMSKSFSVAKTKCLIVFSFKKISKGSFPKKNYLNLTAYFQVLLIRVNNHYVY